jgi:hypothetical protein
MNAAQQINLCNYRGDFPGTDSGTSQRLQRVVARTHLRLLQEPLN